MLRALLDRRYRALLFGIVVFGALLRVGVALELRATDPGWTHPPLDSQVFLDWAREIAAGDLLGDRIFFLNPLYPYFLAPIVGLFPADPLPVIRLLQTILGLATILLVAGATRRLLGPPAALGAALLAAACPLLCFYEQTLMIVPLAVFLNALALFLLARFAERKTVPAALLAGLPLGLSVLARPNVGLFALLLPLWLLSLAPRPGRLRFVSWRTAALLVGVAVVILPVTLRNLAVGGEPVPVTSSMGINLWQSNNPQAWKTGRMGSKEIRFNPRYVETDAIALAERERGRTLTPSEVSAYWRARTLAVMADSPGRAVEFLARKFVYFLGPVEAPSSYHYEMQRVEAPLLRWNPLTFLLLGPLALLGALLSLLRPHRAGLPFALLFLAYAIGLTIFFPLAHYRAPVLPAVFPLAAIALGALLEGPARRRLLTALALVAAFALANLCRPGYDEERVTWWFNRGLMRLAAGERDAARHSFLAARREGPDSYLPDLGFAALARAEGDLDAEAEHLRRALAKRPADPTALGYLGQNRFRRGEREAGLDLIRRAVRADPRDPDLRRILGAALMDAGRLREALAELAKQEELDRARPDNLARRAFCLRHLGRSREALSTAERGLRSYPDFPPLHFERAYALIATGAPKPEIATAVRRGRDAGGRVPPDLAEYLR